MDEFKPQRVMEVPWARRTKRRLQQIGRYISRDNPRAAMQTIDRLREAGNNLGRSPKVDRTGRGTRRLAELHCVIARSNRRHSEGHRITCRTTLFRLSNTKVG